ncbi:amidohydrolase [Fulvivirga sediminis]|uniref:Amidohydrolase family protein n=1 Tax=Fulvivirga sediminis TaxID=2803949 RepID=A0A937F754_9BACT|nr:amidohydrolase [Fulvivirga sediminis]MBL3655504.1 amidohydrolase family protein [Fulvivirga sediminis]
MRLTNTIYKLSLIFLFACVCSISQAQERGDVLIKNGTVLTITNGTLENTDVLIRDGKISKIGKGLKAASGTREIDAAGKYVMPGIIDAHSHIALSSINEATSPVTAEVWTGDALDPLDISIYRALAGGVTISHALHGSANAIGGQSETIKHRYGTVDMDGLRMEGAPRTIKFALGENPTRVHGERSGIVPKTRMGVEAVFRSSFSEAKQYMEKWEVYNSDKGKKGFKGSAPEYNLRLEALADILKGNIIVHCHSYRADEIYMLMQVFKDFGIKKLVFQHVNEGFKVAPELAEFGAMASVFADWWDYKFEVYYSTAYNAAILTKNGVVTSINSDSGELIRHLYHEAAKTQKYGDLSDDEALKLITINPAKQLGIEKRVGSLEEGKDGDVAIFSAHPLSIYTVPLYTIVDGVVKFDKENDPADMRIYPDPEETIDVTLHDREDEDRCMDMGYSNYLLTDK